VTDLSPDFATETLSCDIGVPQVSAQNPHEAGEVAAVTFCAGTGRMSAAVHVPETEPLCPGPSGHAAYLPPPQKNTTTEPVFCAARSECAPPARVVSSLHVRVHEMLAPSALSAGKLACR